MTHNEDASEILMLDPVEIPGIIRPVQTEGAYGGVNHHLINVNTSGLVISIPTYVNMQENDSIEVFWGDSGVPVATGLLPPTNIGRPFAMFVRANRVPEGVHDLHYSVTRAGSGNSEESTPLGILVRTLFPGGTDPEPDAPGHQNLLPPEPELPPSGIIDEEAAKNGVKVTVPGYPNMRVFDTITLSWGGEQLNHEVTQAEVDAASVEFLVTEATILAAGDSDELVLVYRVVDEVHNQSSEWSMRTYLIVEVGEGLFEAPVIVNPDPAAVPPDLIDLDLLGDDDLMVEVYAERSGELLVGDVVALKWVGTTAQGLPITVEPEEQTVSRVPSRLDFIIPNADVKELGLGRAVASYTVSRAGSPIGVSKRSFATFLGVEQRLPKPEVSDAVGDTLDPALATTTVIIPGDALEAGDTVYLTWLGTLANGTPLLKEDQRGVSGGGAGQPMLFEIDGAFIAPLDGGRVRVYYRLHKDSSGTELESDHLLLQVGEAGFELPAPRTLPPAVDGVLDPDDLLEQLEIVIPHWPDMHEDQTVHLLWNAADGPDHDDYMPISEPMVGYDVLFSMNRTLVEANRGQDIALSYWVESPGEANRYSDSARFSIGAREQPVPLPLPTILQANGAQIDPQDVLDGATVSIDASAQFADNDEVIVEVIGNGQGGSTRITHKVPVGDGGEAVTLTIPYEIIEANEGTTFDLRYEIQRADGGPDETSDAVTYSVVREVVPLPLPEILEANGNQLDPDDVLAGATVSIAAEAQFEEHDKVVVRVIGSAEGGSTSVTHWIDTGEGGNAVTVTLPYEVIKANEAASFTLSYNITRAAGGPIEQSDSVTYFVISQVDDGPLRVMGARFAANYHRAIAAPRMLSAISEQTELPMRAEWRYEGETEWTVATQWLDDKPSLKLYVRSRSETWECRPANVFGNGGTDGYGTRAAFAVMRDEVVPGNGKVDVVAWGYGEWGGTLNDAIKGTDAVVELSASGSAYAARLRNGSIVCWGNQHYGGIPTSIAGDFIEIKDSASCFVARKRAGALQGWGTNVHMVPVPPRVLQYTDYVSLHGGTSAMAALRASGHVVAWGHFDYGGTLRPGQDQYNDIKQIASSTRAFAALRVTGNARQVIAWGRSDAGGLVPTEVANLTNVLRIDASTHNCFCILLETGQVKVWPNTGAGGLLPKEVADLRNVVEVTATDQAFCARLSNGKVMAWGEPAHGGKLTPEVEAKSNIVQVTGNRSAFAALCSDGSVVAWGEPSIGGDTAPVASQLYNVRAIYKNIYAFTALTSDGRVVTWGSGPHGGNSSTVQQQLTGRVTQGRRLTAAEAAQVAGTELIDNNAT